MRLKLPMLIILRKWQHWRPAHRWLIVVLALLVLWWAQTAWQTHRLYMAALHDPLACAYYAASRSGPGNDELLRKIAVAYGQKGDFARAQAILDKFPATTYFNLRFPGPRFYFRLEATGSLQQKALGLAALAKLYQQTGHRAEAFAVLAKGQRIIESFENVYSSQEAREAIMLQYATLGEAGQAYAQIGALSAELFLPEDEPGAFRHGYWLTLANHYYQSGQTTASLSALQQAIKACYTIRDQSLIIRALAQTGTAYVHSGQAEQGKALLDCAEAAAAAYLPLSSSDKAMALTTLAEEFARSGECVHAKVIANRIAIEHNRADAHQRIASLCAPV